MRSLHRKLLVGMLVIGAGAAGSVATVAQTPGPRPEVCEVPDRTVTLYAEKMSRGRVGYGLAPGLARVPGPTIEMTEGECIAVKLRNRTDRKLSFHPHGLSYTTASDGTTLNGSCVRPHRRRTYVIEAPAASGATPGSAGYWHYHDHCMGSPHGTEGIERGLFGALIVRRASDPVPEKTFVAVMSGVSFNLRRAPHTPVFRANQGQRVEFVVIGHGELMHTFHLHAHRWADTRTGLHLDASADTQIIDNRSLGPGDSFGFQIVAGDPSGPGAWMYHCHVQTHSDAGMSGIFLVRNPDGSVPPQAERALERWRSGHHG